MKMQKKNFRGQAILEFVLVIPLLLGLLLILFDLGRVTFYYGSINNAAREGARYGIVHKGEVIDTRNTAINAAAGVPGEPLVTLRAFPVFGTDDGDIVNVTVTVEYDFTPATPLVAALISGGGSFITISSQAQMYTE